MNNLELAIELACVFARMEIVTTEFSPIVVLHPYLENAFIYDDNGVFNALEEKERYNKYIENFCHILKKQENISDLLGMIRKSYRLTFLKFLKKENIITLKECGNLLAENWKVIKFLNCDVNVRKNVVLRWISNSDKNILMNKSELKIYKSLSNEIVIYRGVNNKKGKLGISWTLNKEIAEWFATRYNTGNVYKAKIKKENVIGYINSRDEQEIIVDYNKLYDVELLI